MKELIIKEISPLVEQARELKISNTDDLKKSADMLTTCNRYLDELTAQKEKLTKPLNATLKEIRARYKPTEEVLEETIELLRVEQSRYQTALIECIKKEEEKVADMVISGELNVDNAISKIEDIQSPESVDNLSFVSQKKFEVMDVTMLPAEYILPDEVKIRSAMKDGIELPGVRYFTVQVPRNNR